MASSDNIYTIEVDFTVGSKAYAVSAVTILLRDKAIPEATVVVDPTHSPSAASPTATVTGLSDLAKWSAEAQTLALKRESTNLSIRVYQRGTKVQSVTLTDWKLISAGIGSVSASGSFSMVFTIQHPIGLTDVGNLFFGNLLGAQQGNYVPVVTDVLAAFTSAFDYLVKKTLNPKLSDISGLPTGAVSPTKTAANYNAQMKVALDALNSSLEMAPGIQGWPAIACLELMGAVDTRKKNMARKFMEHLVSGPDATIWEFISNILCGTWGLTTIPVYWKPKLILTPFEPWQAPKIYILPSDISNMTLPAVDPSPVVGTYATASYDAMGGSTVWAAEGEMQSSIEYVMYAAAGPDKLKGRVVPVALPEWINTFVSKEATVNPTKSNLAVHSKSGISLGPNNASDKDQVPGGASDKKPNWHAYLGMAYRYAFHAFLSLFRAGVQTSVIMPLTIQALTNDTEDGYVYPGVVARVIPGGITSESVGQSISDFYITSVVHTMDCGQGKASTEIVGSYSRPAGAFPGIVNEGQKNPIYSENATPTSNT